MSNKNDDERGSDVDLSGYTDAINSEVEWRTVAESGNTEVVVVGVDVDKDCE